MNQLLIVTDTDTGIRHAALPGPGLLCRQARAARHRTWTPGVASDIDCGPCWLWRPRTVGDGRLG